MTGIEVPGGTGGWSAVSLVAGREIRTRLRSKAFAATTVITLVLLVGFAVVMKLISGTTSDATVGVTQQTAPMATVLEGGAKSIGENVSTKQVAEAAGRDQVRDGTLDALLIGDGTKVTVVVKKDLDGKLHNALNVLANQVALNQQIVKLGGDPRSVDKAVATANVQVEPLEPPHTYQSQQLILGIVAGVLVYLSLLLNGQAVAQGVVEEKSSRVVELLLATVRPWQLMIGKVFGVGLVGLLQMVIIGAGGLGAAIALGSLPSTTAAIGTVIWLVVWYLLGFLMYAIVFAALGALVSRQEEVGGVVTPALMFVIAGYVIGISILPSDPSNSLCEVLSIIPVFAPTLMPMRLAMGGVPIWEAVVSVALVVALIPLLTWLSGRIYRNAVVWTGSRMRLSRAWRSA